MAEYIDRKALIADIHEAIDLYGMGLIAGQKMIQFLKRQPAADVAEVKQGKWEEFTTSAYIGMDEYGEPKWADRRFYVHKECGRRSAIKEKFCPNCGVKMKED